jgi:hypothetical protein
MKYILVVFNRAGDEVFRKEYEGVSASFMHEIHKDYAYLGGPGATTDFYPVEE